MSEGTMSGAAALSAPGTGPSAPGTGAALNRGGPPAATDAQAAGARDFHRVLENHLPEKGGAQDAGKPSGKKKRAPDETGPGHSRIDPGSTPAVLPGPAGTAARASVSAKAKVGKDHPSPASFVGPAGHGESLPASSAGTSTPLAGKGQARGGSAAPPDAGRAAPPGSPLSGTVQVADPGSKGLSHGSGTGAGKASGRPGAVVGVHGQEAALMQGVNGQGPDAPGVSPGVNVPAAPPGDAAQGEKTGHTKKASDSRKAPVLPGVGAAGNPVVGIEASGRGVQQDPPTLQALAARKGFVEGPKDGGSPSSGSAQVSPGGRSHRMAPSDSGAGSSAGDGAPLQTLPGALVLGQDPGMQELPGVLTNVPSERVADAVGANLAGRPWRPGETATLRVTVVPADLGPVQVIAHMDAQGQLHVQIHALSPETQAILQQQSGQLIHHLQQHHIPVQRLDVTGSPMTSGGTGPGAGFTGGAGSGQGQPNPGFQSPAPAPGPGGEAALHEGRDGLGESPWVAQPGARSPGTHAFEATV